jgi:hypothetical protein
MTDPMEYGLHCVRRWSLEIDEQSGARAGECI